MRFINPSFKNFSLKFFFFFQFNFFFYIYFFLSSQKKKKKKRSYYIIKKKKKFDVIIIEMTLFKTKSKVNPSDTSDTKVNEKKDEKNYNSSIIPTDDDNCTITIIVPPTARPVNSRYSMQYLKQFQHEQVQPQQLNTEDYSSGPPKLISVTPSYSWKSILIITLITLKLMIIVGK
jgi:hypothetical protein